MRNILTIILLFLSTVLMAQASRGDQLYAEGLTLQKVQTVSSQKSAIQKFKQAKVAYSNVEKKRLCDIQISVCNKSIKRLQYKPKNQVKPVIEVIDTAQTIVDTVKVEVLLSVSETRLDFKAQAKENKTVKVSCNYGEWEISSKPEWLKVYVAPGEFSAIPEENEGDDRSGIIDITCQDKTVRVIVNQSKLKGFKGFFKKLK